MIVHARSILPVLLAAICAVPLGTMLLPAPSLAGSPSANTSSAPGSGACTQLDSGQPWNRPAPQARHPLSAELSRQLWQEGADRPGNINILSSYAVYRAGPGDPLYRVRSRLGNLDGELVRFRKGWRAYHDDGQIIVFTNDDVTYEFYDAEVDDASRTITARRAERLAAGRKANPNSRGIGLPYAHMLILDCEIRAGRIEHALSLRVGKPRCGEAWYPASKVENHADCTKDGIPIGARFVMRFTPARIDEWAAGLRKKGGAPLERFGRAVAAALQTHGFYVTDNGGGAAGLDMQHPETFAPENPLLPLATKNIGAIRDLLDGLIAEGDISLVAETGPRIHDPR